MEEAIDNFKTLGGLYITYALSTYLNVLWLTLSRGTVHLTYRFKFSNKLKILKFNITTCSMLPVNYKVFELYNQVHEENSFI
jgi:hypothetical protein